MKDQQGKIISKSDGIVLGKMIELKIFAFS